MSIFTKLFEKLFYKQHHFPKNPYNPHCWIIGNPHIEEECWIGPFTLIDASGGLKIGRGTTISSGVHVYTHSAVRRNISKKENTEVDRKSVEIGKYVHIGPNSTILMGVKIGDHSVIGAGSVITEGMQIPPYSVVVGVPARITEKNSRDLL